MADDSELEARIAALSQQIDRHKTESGPASPGGAQYPQSAHPHYRKLGLGKLTSGFEGRGRGSNRWTPQRGTPYGVPVGRGRGYRPASIQNRTLVLNGRGAKQSSNQAMSPALASPDAQQPSQTSRQAPGWVTKRDRHMQLINNTVFEKKTMERTMAMQETREMRAQAREEREKSKMSSLITSLRGQSTVTQPTQTQAPPSITVNEIRFVITDGGSKLIKTSGESIIPDNAQFLTPKYHKDESNLAKITPKRAVVGGVQFLRSRHGNLYRSGLVKAKGSVDDIVCVDETDAQMLKKYRNEKGVKKSSELCPQFCSTGRYPPLSPAHVFLMLH